MHDQSIASASEVPAPVARKKSRLSEPRREPTDLELLLAAQSNDPSYPFKYGHGKIESASTRFLSLIPRERSKARNIDFDRLPKTGSIYTDHMLRIEYTESLGWSNPVIDPLAPLQIHPGAKVLQYANEIFDGMKAFHGHDGKIRLYRPRDHLSRFNRSAQRACLPTVDEEELLNCIKSLVKLEAHWIPKTPGGYLYIRPTLIGTDFTIGPAAGKTALLFVMCSPGGPYFGGPRSPLRLYVNAAYERTAKGIGAAKMGCNYAGGFAVQQLAKEQGCAQILWLSGPQRELTECSGMNIFVLWQNEEGELELATPSLKSEILDGITRRTILELVRLEQPSIKVKETRINLTDIKNAVADNRMIEMFGSGSAVGIAPVNSLVIAGPTDGTHTELAMPDAVEHPLSLWLFRRIGDIQEALMMTARHVRYPNVHENSTADPQETNGSNMSNSRTVKMQHAMATNCIEALTLCS